MPAYLLLDQFTDVRNIIALASAKYLTLLTDYKYIGIQDVSKYLANISKYYLT